MGCVPSKPSQSFYYDYFTGSKDRTSQRSIGKHNKQGPLEKSASHRTNASHRMNVPRRTNTSPKTYVSDEDRQPNKAPDKQDTKERKSSERPAGAIIVYDPADEMEALRLTDWRRRVYENHRVMAWDGRWFF
ncbi:hypothetical protein MMC28_008348 [Mycoblastus sanguinarius]|nr:hypothetical protein [Mycoblastus sanguinarius]